MKPDRPLSWISTTKRNRDQGLFHLVATLEVRSYKSHHPQAVCVAACGAQPFSYGGSFADDDPTVSPGVRCSRCVALLEPIYVQCPNPGCRFRDSALAVKQLRFDLPCPSCGQFKLREFLPVPR